MKRWTFIIALFLAKITFAQINETQYDYVGLKGSKLIVVSKNGKFGFINKKGEEVIPMIYDGAWDFTFGIAAVEKNSKWGFINEKGKIVIPMKYEYADYFNGKYAPVKYKGKWYDINKKGKIIRERERDYEVIPAN